MGAPVAGAPMAGAPVVGVPVVGAPVAGAPVVVVGSAAEGALAVAGERALWAPITKAEMVEAGGWVAAAATTSAPE